ncbi:uncharacterized protein LOC143021711 [Oratosquilla oratoria]|uniref:uncharacterized protein LOC143021711 n=1 Tax=Oratosquilla oratoria TaxID=337810 RepID=UPI003F769686
MRVAIFVLGLAIVSGQRFQKQIRQPVVSPAVLLASNARIQEKERLLQDGQNFNIEDQSNFNSDSNLNLRADIGVQSVSDSEFRQPTFRENSQLLHQSQDSQPIDGVFEPLNLPSGAYLLMGQIDTSFSCADRPYGYYADQGNDCRVFHVCNPYLFDDGRVETQQYSFMCNEHTVFDQKELTCVEQYAANPCEESYLHYSRNEEFGLPEEKN